MNLNKLTQQPQNLVETGLQEELTKELLLKHLFDGVILDLHQLRSRLKLAGSRYFCESLFWASLPKQAAKT